MHGRGVAHLLALLSHLSFSSFLSLSSHPAPAAALPPRASPARQGGGVGPWRSSSGAGRAGSEEG